VSVQPVVLLNICDSYIRRNDGQARVIGTLLGSITDGVVEIKNCYAVPHNETNDQVRLWLSCQWLKEGPRCAPFLHFTHAVAVRLDVWRAWCCRSRWTSITTRRCTTCTRR